VLVVGSDDVRDAVARAEAVTAVRGSEDFTAVSAAFKRMKNILAQAAEKGIVAGVGVDAALLTEPSEKALADRSVELVAQVSGLRQKKNTPRSRGYRHAPSAGRCLLRRVMVMAPEPNYVPTGLDSLLACLLISPASPIFRRS